MADSSSLPIATQVPEASEAPDSIPAGGTFEAVIFILLDPFMTRLRAQPSDHSGDRADSEDKSKKV